MDALWTLPTGNLPVRASPWCLNQQHGGCVCNGTQRLQKQARNDPTAQMGAQGTGRNSLQENSQFVHEQSAVQAALMSCSHTQPSTGVSKTTWSRDWPIPELPTCIPSLYLPACLHQLTTAINPSLFIRPLSYLSSAPRLAVTAQLH